MRLWQIHVADNRKIDLGSHVQCPIFLFDFNKIWSFLTDFNKSLPIPNFTEIRPVGAALRHGEDGRT